MSLRDNDGGEAAEGALGKASGKTPGKLSCAVSGRPSRAASRKATCSSATSSMKSAKSVKVDVDGLAVWVTRKRVKNVRLCVKADGRVEVSAPFSASDAFIGDFVRSKSTWIARRRAELASSPMARAAEATPEEVAEWRAVVQACVPPLVEQWEKIMGVRAGKLAYRNMTSRWGSCQPSTGRICINVRLALYPPECLEYVVVHELCHLIERGHGPAFQALMTCLMPDWKERRAKLR